MAEGESKLTAIPPSSEQQAADTVPMSEGDKKTMEGEATTDELSQTYLGEPSLPIPMPTKDLAADEEDSGAKGKDTEDQGPAHVEKPHAQRNESDSLEIGPSDPPAVTTTTTEAPVCAITLLLPTGARHPYKIDERYLAKRNVEVPDVTESGKKDPFSISIYKLKELILREWRDEWEGKPASPSSIRLIHFGKLLDDKEQLKKYQFSHDNPNVVHMSVRPAEMMEEDEAGKGKSSAREGRRGDRGSGCCVIL